MLDVLIAGYEAPDRLGSFCSTGVGVDFAGMSAFGNGEAMRPLPPTGVGVSLLTAAFLKVSVRDFLKHELAGK